MEATWLYYIVRYQISKVIVFLFLFVLVDKKDEELHDTEEEERLNRKSIEISVTSGKSRFSHCSRNKKSAKIKSK